MKRPEVVELIARLKQKYCKSYVPYGTSDEEEEGTGFRIAGIEATFSAMCMDTPEKMYDIQIESYPPGNYLYNDLVNLDDFLALIEKYREPSHAWPINEPN